MTGDRLGADLRIEFEDLDDNTAVMLVGLGDGPLVPDEVIDMTTFHAGLLGIDEAD